MDQVILARATMDTLLGNRIGVARPGGPWGRRLRRRKTVGMRCYTSPMISEKLGLIASDIGELSPAT